MNNLNRNNAAETRAVPGIWGIQANSEQVGQYEKFELKLDVAGEWENPYDPDEVDLGKQQDIAFVLIRHLKAG